jgi:hypothetical protein
MESIVDYSASKGLNYPPINGSSSRFYWLSTTSGRNSVTAIRYANATAIYYTSTSKSITDGYSYICRNHFN